MHPHTKPNTGNRAPTRGKYNRCSLCGKRSYVNRDAAIQHIWTMKRSGKHVPRLYTYRCEGGWIHLTRRPTNQHEERRPV